MHGMFCLLFFDFPEGAAAAGVDVPLPAVGLVAATIGGVTAGAATAGAATFAERVESLDGLPTWTFGTLAAGFGAV